MRRVNIKDVAKEAGVSPATVSYVLNQKETETISAETTQRVFQAIERLNYVPNLNARSLSSKKTNLIGVVIPQTEPGKEMMFGNPFYGELLSSIEYTARRQGYHLLLSGPETNQSYMNIACNRGVDGIIIVGSYPTKSLDELHQLSVPVVLIDTYVSDPVFHTIGIDDKAGGRMVTRYLIDRGHKNIAFVSGSISEQGVNLKRFQGYQEALAQEGIAVEQKNLYLGTVEFEYGMAAAQQMLARGNGETAAFVTADILGTGLVKGLRRLGLHVPQDISVVGFDDVSLARMCDPSLTTVWQDIAEKGRCAVRMILDSTHGKEGKQECILPIRLVERESVRSIS